MSRAICWVETVSESDATGTVRAMYDAVGEEGAIHNLYRAGSLFPQPVTIADRLYKAIMHDAAAPLEACLSELMATQVAILADCHYALTHHGANFRHLHPHGETADAILSDLLAGRRPTQWCDDRVLAMLDYVTRLSDRPRELTETDIETLRSAGVSDAEIVHLNQVAASFAYWVRIINGLGIQLGDETIGKYGTGGDTEHA